MRRRLRLFPTMRVRSRHVLIAGVVLALSPAATGPPALAAGACTGTVVATPKAGPKIRFGITPGVQTGQLTGGPIPPRTPEVPSKQLAALAQLRPAGAPFVLRLHRLFWSDGESGIKQFLALAKRYTRHGYLVELQVRYHPTAAQAGDIPAWVKYVRQVVDKFGPNRRVVALQVTNEVNFGLSSDSSDSSYTGARDALIQGVEAAKAEARKRRFRQLTIGFNWAYRGPPQQEDSFWNYLRDNGGKRFVSSLDWVGVDAYPGTFFPPVDTPGGERDALVNAFSTFRCYAATPGIAASVPIHVEENGWPTGPGRTYDSQAQALQTMVQAVSDFRGTFNISDYRWFNLRDGDSTSTNFQTQYGLMTDEYVPKPAFGLYRQLVAQLTIRPPARQTSRTRGRGVR
ncbi:MAG: hypothetical protein JOZ25_08400 [Actinobacteria bacterium]|nr:hypothetical protein [Actinomycetota bacterium]